MQHVRSGNGRQEGRIEVAAEFERQKAQLFFCFVFWCVFECLCVFVCVCLCV